MKLLRRVVKSSSGINYNGTVSIDNTVIRRPTASELENAEEESTMTAEEIDAHLKFYEKKLNEEHRQRLESLEKEKQDILTQAQQEAERIISDAQTSAVSIKVQAQTQGYNEGFEKGNAEAISKLRDSFEAVQKLIEKINESKEQMYIKNENELLDLAYEMAEKITLSEIKSDKEIIFAIVKQACKSFRNSEYIKISLAGCDVEKTVVSDAKLIKSLANGIPEVEVEVLKDAESGTVLIDNDSEIIDASVGTQLDFLKQVYNSSKKAQQ